MTPRCSRVLRLLAAGDFPTCLKINLADPRAVEIAGLGGLDAVWLCHEHVPNDWLALEHQIRAARIHDMDTLVRIGRGSYSDYIRPFEAGATGIIVPHVASAADARQIVEWVRFHPLGKCALDGGNADGLYAQLPLADYIRHCNAQRVVILQIESPEAVARLPEIAAVEGYNGLLFGPGDFSHRIGRPGEFDAPEVVQARRQVAAAAREHGKFAMTAGLLAPAAELVAEGYQVFNVGADVIALSDFLARRLEHLRTALAAIPPTAAAVVHPHA